MDDQERVEYNQKQSKINSYLNMLYGRNSEVEIDEELKAYNRKIIEENLPKIEEEYHKIKGGKTEADVIQEVFGKILAEQHIDLLKSDDIEYKKFITNHAGEVHKEFFKRIRESEKMIKNLKRKRMHQKCLKVY